MGSERDVEFTAFAREAEPRLVRQGLLLTGDPHTALDHVQSTLLTVYLRWSRIETPLAYARTTLTREFLADRRRRGRERVTDSLAPTGGIPGPAEIVTTRGVTLTALLDLPPRMRAVVVLRYWEDLGVEETARLLGCSTGTVKSTASKGLARLSDALGETFWGRRSRNGSPSQTERTRREPHDRRPARTTRR